MAYKRIEVNPILPAIGAEITGARLDSVCDEAVAEIRQALLEHHFLSFPNQDVSPKSLMDLARHFGTLNVHPFLPHLNEHPEVIIIDKTKEQAGNVGNGWHSDMTFLEKPPLGSILHAKIVPPHGGDTLFCNMYRAYEALSKGMKNLLNGLIAVHDYTRRFLMAVSKGTTPMTEDQIRAARKDYPLVEHPVVRTHPETGRKLLFVNSFFTSHFKDMTEEESQPLLKFLTDHIDNPEFALRYRWEKNAVGFWDNRCTQHYAINDYTGHRRMMHRITVNGDRPY